MTSLEQTQLGRTVRRPDALGKVTGETLFAADLVAHNMLHAELVCSPHPYARIRGIDRSAALACPGVAAVLTAADIPGRNQVGVILKDHPCLAETFARFAGDCVALVAAETAEQARHAAGQVAVDYEILPPILDPELSRAEGATLLHEAGNVPIHLKVRKGDLDQGFAEADVVVRHSVELRAQEHLYLEPIACLASPTTDGGYKLQGSMQCPYYIQAAIAGVLGLPMSKISVIQSPTGGGFGGKEDTPSEFYTRAILLAHATGRPVKLLLRREDDVRWTSKRHPVRLHYKLGARADGTLTALEAEIVGDCGAYATLSPVVLWRAAVHAGGPYVIPHARVDTYGIYTNRAPSGAFRGFGAPQACVAIETTLDLLAAELGRDPAELRLQNIIRPGQQTLSQHEISDCACLEPVIEAALDGCNWREKWRAPGQDTGRYRRGIGMAAIHYGNSLGAKGWHLDGSGVSLMIFRDGSVTFACGHTEIGQGAITTLSVIAAEALGITPAHVRMHEVDTSIVPDSGPTVASRATIMSGNAILDAARQLIDEFRPLAAELLEVDPAQVRFGDGEVFADERSISWEALCGEAYMQNLRMSSCGWYAAPKSTYDDETGAGSCYFQYAYATQIAEVEVDTLTGRTRVIRVTAAHDVGRAIYPAGIEGQVEGGIAQGMGYALCEDLVEDGEGRILTANFSTYILPSIMETPEVRTILLEGGAPHGPYGVKSIGEPAIIPTAAAIANALYNATGRRIDLLPMTPERLCDRLEQTE